MACFGACFEGLDRLVNGPLHDLDYVITNKDEEAMERWCQHVVRSAGRKKSEHLNKALRLAAHEGDPNVRLDSGECPLHLAVEVLQVELVQQLLHAGASAEVTDSKGRQSWEIARQSLQEPMLLMQRTRTSKAMEQSEKEIEAALKQAMSTMRNQRFVDEMSFISKVPLFANVSPDELPRLAAAFTLRRYEAGMTVVTQGEAGQRMFVIQQGTAAVKVQRPGMEASSCVATLHEGDFFGEASLLRNCPRTATVEALEDLLVHCLGRADFDRLDLRHQLRFRKRQAVHAREAHEPAAPCAAPTPKTEQQRQEIQEGLLANMNLGPLLAHMSPDNLSAIVEQASFMSVASGEAVVTQGDLKANSFYVISEGSFEVSKNDRVVSQLGPGDSFGEKALLYHHARAATVKAASSAGLWVISRKALQAVTHAQLKSKLEEYSRLLQHVDVFREVSQENRALLADALVETTFYQGEYIIRQGEEGQSFFVLHQGTVAVDMDGQEVSVMESKPGEEQGKSNCFGERALLHDEPRMASVRVVSERAKVLALDRSIFLRVLEPERAAGCENGKTMELVEYSRDSLKQLGLLGCGGFGAVSLVKCGITGNYFALKALSKGHVITMGQPSSVMNECKILRMIHSPFLVRCAATFNSPQQLYFLLEPVMGGELFTVYHRRNLFGSEAHARFYVACTLRALEYLHQRYVIYRDLKSENLLLDENGYCKLTDFGLAKFVIGHSFTTCGTPDYFAPEMVNGTGHTIALDWWTLGILIFEFMTSDTPFSAEDTMLTFHKVKRGVGFVCFPSSADWTDLVKGLLTAEPSERLPMRKGGVKNIEEHAWFNSASFDWSALDQRTMRPPFKPSVKHPADITNFSVSESDMPPQVPYEDPHNGWDDDFEDRRGPAKFD